MATLDELQQQLAALSARVDALTTPPDDYYTSKYSGEEIDAGITKTESLPESWPLPIASGGTGADTPQLALANLGGRPNRNLFDNWYFVGGGTQGSFPINQEPQSSHQEGQSIADRWKSASGDTTYSLEPDGLLCSGGTSFISQKVEDYLADYLHGKRITISALWLDNYLFSHTWVFEKNQQELSEGLFVYIPDVGFIIPRSIGAGNQKTMVAAKLEKGDKQTLAYRNSSGVLKLFMTPNYGDMLERCQRYKLALNQTRNQYVFFGQGNAWDGNRCLVHVPIPVTMRTIPVVTYSSGLNLRNGQTYAPITSLSVYSSGENLITLDAKVESGLDAGKQYDLICLDTNGSIVFSAEL